MAPATGFSALCREFLPIDNYNPSPRNPHEHSVRPLEKSRGKQRTERRIAEKTGKRGWEWVKQAGTGSRGSCRKCASPLGTSQKNGPTENSWAKGIWWCNADLGSNSLLQQVRKVSGVCPLFAEIVRFILWKYRKESHSLIQRRAHIGSA